MVRRRVEVHHQVDVVDVDAAGGHVGGDQHPRAAVREAFQRALAGVLGQVAVDRHRVHAGGAELHGEPVGAVLGPYEEQGPRRPSRNFGGDRNLGVTADREDQVVHRVDRRGRRGHRVHGRALEVGLGELVHTAVEGCGEEQPLSVVGGEVEQLGDGRHEAEVSHVVGLVEDRDADLRQVALALFDQVLQATGGGDDDVGAAPELVDLTAHRGAAVDRHDFEVEGLAERRERIVHLLRQLAGRHQDQGAGGLGHSRSTDQPGQDRQPKGQGLAGTSLTATQDIPAGDRVRQGAGLDSEGGFDTSTSEGGDELVGQTELVEGRHRLSGSEDRGVRCSVETDLKIALDGRGRARAGTGATAAARGTATRGTATGRGRAGTACVTWHCGRDSVASVVLW